MNGVGHAAKIPVFFTREQKSKFLVEALDREYLAIKVGVGPNYGHGWHMSQR